MACCLAAPSHYLNQCWFIISEVQWHSSEGNFPRETSVINHQNLPEQYLSKIYFKSPRGQWVLIKVVTALFSPHSSGIANGSGFTEMPTCNQYDIYSVGCLWKRCSLAVVDGIISLFPVPSETHPTSGGGDVGDHSADGVVRVGCRGCNWLPATPQRESNCTQ